MIIDDHPKFIQHIEHEVDVISAKWDVLYRNRV